MYLITRKIAYFAMWKQQYSQISHIKAKSDALSADALVIFAIGKLRRRAIIFEMYMLYPQEMVMQASSSKSRYLILICTWSNFSCTQVATLRMFLIVTYALASNAMMKHAKPTILGYQDVRIVELLVVSVNLTNWILESICHIQLLKSSRYAERVVHWLRFLIVGGWVRLLQE